jgi:hypothetical protein
MEGKLGEEHPKPLPDGVTRESLERAVRKVLAKPMPPGGWPGKPPKEVRADEEDTGGDG